MGFLSSESVNDSSPLSFQLKNIQVIYSLNCYVYEMKFKNKISVFN